MNGWPTTRRHPRSLADAFADVRACAIEHHRTPRPHRLAGIALAILIGISLGWALVEFITPGA